jgi:hypothetical protein
MQHATLVYRHYYCLLHPGTAGRCKCSSPPCEDTWMHGRRQQAMALLGAPRVLQQHTPQLCRVSAHLGVGVLDTIRRPRKIWGGTRKPRLPGLSDCVAAFDHVMRMHHVSRQDAMVGNITMSGCAHQQCMRSRVHPGTELCFLK